VGDSPTVESFKKKKISSSFAEESNILHIVSVFLERDFQGIVINHKQAIKYVQYYFAEEY
jgi:hypothetical protein